MQKKEMPILQRRISALQNMRMESRWCMDFEEERGAKMNKFDNWKEVTKGLFRYVISANVAYEIRILNWDHATDILSANCDLCIVGEWVTNENRSITTRECLLGNAPLLACIGKAVEDDAENNSY